jgi:hypothetical protein
VGQLQLQKNKKVNQTLLERIAEQDIQQTVNNNIIVTG